MAIAAPSHGSIALATSIIQSKPEELTVEGMDTKIFYLVRFMTESSQNTFICSDSISRRDGETRHSVQRIATLTDLLSGEVNLSE